MSLAKEMVSLVPQSEARDIFCDFAEAALDSTVNEGVLKDIPVVGTIVRAGSAVLTVKDRIFIRKVGRFLNALSDVPQDKIATFLKELDKDDMRQKVGEKLILLIDRQDELDKAFLIGLVFSHYVAGQMNRHDFEMISHAITLSFLPDIEHLQLYLDKPSLLDDPLGSALLASGLATIRVKVADGTWAKAPETTNIYALSRIGIVLALIMKDFANKKTQTRPDNQ